MGSRLNSLNTKALVKHVLEAKLHLPPMPTETKEQKAAYRQALLLILEGFSAPELESEPESVPEEKPLWVSCGAELCVVVALMFAFGYALVPIYNSICAALGINVLSLAELDVQGGSRASAAKNSQIDLTRSITIEFDANARGPWEFKPEKRSVEVHPGELTTVMYEFRNTQNRTMAAQAIPSYAPM